MFVLAYWRNTSFHAPRQQCYPLRCEKQRQGRTKGIFHTDFCQDQLPAKAVDIPKCVQIPMSQATGQERLQPSGAAKAGACFQPLQVVGFGRDVASCCRAAPKPFCSVMPHIRITAQQAQKPRAWRPWATFCSLKSLGTQQSLWVSLRGQLRGARRRSVLLHTNHPVSQRGRCVQLPITRRAHVLPGGCWRVAEAQAVPAAMRGCGRGDADLPGASDPRGCEKQPLRPLLLHLGKQKGSSVVLLHPSNVAKGRKEADGGEWS